MLNCSADKEASGVLRDKIKVAADARGDGIVCSGAGSATGSTR